VKIVLTETVYELFDLLTARDVNFDSCIGTILTLKTEDKFKELIKWIHAHPRARQYQILGQLDIFKKNKPVASCPHATRKIASVAVF